MVADQLSSGRGLQLPPGADAYNIVCANRCIGGILYTMVYTMAHTIIFTMVYNVVYTMVYTIVQPWYKPEN